MGFKREHVERVLVLNNNNLERSIDMLVKEQALEDQNKQEENIEMKNGSKETSKD